MKCIFSESCGSNFDLVKMSESEDSSGHCLTNNTFIPFQNKYEIKSIKLFLILICKDWFF